MFSDSSNFAMIDDKLYVIDNGTSYKSKLRNMMELDHLCFEEFIPVYPEDPSNDVNQIKVDVAKLHYDTEEIDEDEYLIQHTKNYNSTTFIKSTPAKKYTKKNKTNQAKIGNLLKITHIENMQPAECELPDYRQKMYCGIDACNHCKKYNCKWCIRCTCISCLGILGVNTLDDDDGWDNYSDDDDWSSLGS